MVRRLLLLSLVILTFFAVAQAGTSTAQGTKQAINFLCTEDPITGCVIQLPFGGTTTAWAASDGDSSVAFDPWGSGVTNSDYIALNPGWVQSVGSVWGFCGNCTNPPFVGANIWIAPELNETIGYFDFPGNVWNFTGVIQFGIYEPDGSLSDIIGIGNFGPGGDAGLYFQSTPEPSSLLLLGSGLIGAVGVARRRLLK